MTSSDATVYDATVEQTLRAAQDINAAPSEASPEAPVRDIFDIFNVLRGPKTARASASAPDPATQLNDAAPFGFPARAAGRPADSGLMREEMERRAANYRAFQMKLNEDREARIRKTMADVRIKLQRIGSQGPHPLP